MEYTKYIQEKLKDHFTKAEASEMLDINYTEMDAFEKKGFIHSEKFAHHRLYKKKEILDFAELMKKHDLLIGENNDSEESFLPESPLKYLADYAPWKDAAKDKPAIGEKIIAITLDAKGHYSEGVEVATVISDLGDCLEIEAIGTQTCRFWLPIKKNKTDLQEALEEVFGA